MRSASVPASISPIRRAPTRPSGFIGCEPFVQGVAGLLRHLEDDGTADRVRIFPDDARLLLDRLPEACIGRLFVLFSDPWPKKRHHKRRLIDGETLNAFARILKDGAEFRWASDDSGYVEWTLEHVARNQAFALDRTNFRRLAVTAGRLAGDPPMSKRLALKVARLSSCAMSAVRADGRHPRDDFVSHSDVGAVGRNTLKRHPQSAIG